MQNQFYQTPFQKRSLAADFRSTARETLKGRWGLAIGLFLLATILGLSNGVAFSFGTESVQLSDDPRLWMKELQAIRNALESGHFSSSFEATKYYLIGGQSLLDVFLDGVFSLAFALLVGAPISVGYHKFLLLYADRNPEARTGILFSEFGGSRYGKTMCLHLLIGAIHGIVPVLTSVLTVFLCVLGLMTFNPALLMLAGLVGIGGAVASVWVSAHLALCYYIYAEYPDLAVTDVIRNSIQLMNGNKWRWFCLQCSFIGWLLLTAICTCGIATVLYVAPYMNAANTAFYNEISGRDTAKEVEFPSINPDDYFPQV